MTALNSRLDNNLQEFQVAGALPGGNAVAYDLSSTVEPTSWYGTLLAGAINLTPSATVLEISVWIGYAIGVLFLFFRPANTATRRPATKVAA
jgi:high-affinity iron transporter